MTEYTVTISDESKAGYDYEATRTGAVVKDLISQFAEEKGISYLYDSKRAKVQDMAQAIEKHPEAYEAAVTAIKAVKDAEDEALKPVEPIDPKESIEPVVPK